jgi:hypothetical protein
MPPDVEARQFTQATKLTLIGVFLGLLAAFTARQASRGEDARISPFDLLLLGLSAYRAGHLIAYERVTEPVRAPLTDTIPDQSGVGDTVVASGAGVRYALGELVSCPTCVGTWAAAGLVYGLHLAPRPTRIFLAVMGTTGVAEVLHCTTEAASWVGRAARAYAGAREQRR